MKNIIFDFDGVILDSLAIRELGFREIFKTFDKDKVEELVEYHHINGGWSRFIKIKYFFNELLEKEITQNEIEEYASKYSNIMKDNLTKKSNLILDTVNFIQKYHTKINMHIASGSEQNELQYLNKQLEIDKYFKSIYGSPTTKSKLVENILRENNYNQKDTILIGDSINDYEAAKENNISFFGYNNVSLKDIGNDYLNDFKELEKEFDL